MSGGVGPGASAAVLRRRDRMAILSALAGVTAICWLYLVVMARGMSAMSADSSPTLEIHAWSPTEFLLMFAMWVIMMIGMMLPSAAPAALVYAAVARKAANQGTPVAPTAVFVSGYLGIWAAFSLAATLAQWALDQAALLSPMMVATSPLLGAGLLVAAGVYQLTPFKEACLEHCRSPAHFLARYWRPGSLGAWRLGLRHGAFCLGCCWLLMGLLFFGGVMNLLWIAGITLFVVAEKALPRGVAGGRLAGVAMILTGLVVASALW